MKKLIQSSIIAFFCITAIVAFIPMASGKTVTSDMAQTVAANFFRQNANMTVNSISLAYTETSESGEAVYFAYNINAGKGFIIITADDAMYPVIGYSTEGSFVVPDHSSNAGYWMEQRKNEIIANKLQKFQATSEISAQWSAYLSGNTVAPRVSSTVAPLIQTLWDQYPNYNALCPGGSVTGCNATTMAQIMRYWKWPVKGTGSSSYNCPNYGTLSANYGVTTYNWDNMPTGNVTSANNDVATLMYQIGISVAMQYSPSGSGSMCTTHDASSSPCAQTSYSKYFGYYPPYGLQRSNYTDQLWLAVIEADLKASRPVQYCGWDPAGLPSGHTWVCDGFDANNNLHMNWGWSGSDDGYFSITSLNPGNNNFSKNEEVIADIRPYNPAGIPSISNDEIVSIYPNPASNQITIHTSSSRISATTTVSIVNMLGQETSLPFSLQWKGEDAVIDISKLSKGMYFLEMKTESGIDTKMFVKE